ncbi:MAG: MoxR family ATPase [Firmicutes bacterium]|nr:MoxR family ATPase [Bacillota bacterium]
MDKIKKVKEEIKKVIKGKDHIIDRTLEVMLCGGHILLEDMPGVGKTTLSTTISRVIKLEYKRVQFTPDVMPGDITGYYMYDKKSGEFVYRKGACMCNLLLADEINRTSPKTQSALLEIMEEGKVTVESETRELPKPFTVIATQNPFGSFGTQRLPQSQLDRFLIKISMGYPDKASEIEILKNPSREAIDDLENVIEAEDIIKYKKEIANIHTDEKIYEYITNIANATRESEYTDIGVSPRGSRAMLKMARAEAFMNGKDYVSAENVKNVYYDVCNHRIELSARAKSKGMTEKDVLEEIIDNVKVPRL